MIDARMLVLSTLAAVAAVTAVVATPGSENLVSRRTDPGGPVAQADDSAWALLAEAEELCRGTQRGAAVDAFQAGGDGTSASARRALAEEALEITRELAVRVSAASSSGPILEAERRLRRRCGKPWTFDLPPGPLRSLDGSFGLERAALIGPFLARLNEAAEIKRARVSGPTLPAVPAPANSVRADPSPTPEPSGSASVAEAASSAGGSDPPARESAEPVPAIRIEGGSARYRERLRSWSAVFDREAPALRAGRRELQVEIERHSMAEARAACRGFGLVLARIDEDLTAAAPSRGLSILVERMIARYWRGVAQCVSGRPAAAFAYLSEGDRDWATVAQTASRMIHPRLMRPLRPVPLPPEGAHATD